MEKEKLNLKAEEWSFEESMAHWCIILLLSTHPKSVVGSIQAFHHYKQITCVSKQFCTSHLQVNCLAHQPRYKSHSHLEVADKWQRDPAKKLKIVLFYHTCENVRYPVLINNKPEVMLHFRCLRWCCQRIFTHKTIILEYLCKRWKIFVSPGDIPKVKEHWNIWLQIPVLPPCKKKTNKKNKTFAWNFKDKNFFGVGVITTLYVDFFFR